MADNERLESQGQKRNTPEEIKLTMCEGEEDGTYILRLYVTGTTPNSQRAIKNVHKLCEEHLQGRFELEIIDIYQQPKLAREGQIVAAPTLIKKFPLPLRRFIGDMSRTEKILMGLELRPKK